MYHTYRPDNRFLTLKCAELFGRITTTLKNCIHWLERRLYCNSLLSHSHTISLWQILWLHDDTCMLLIFSTALLLPIVHTTKRYTRLLCARPKLTKTFLTSYRGVWLLSISSSLLKFYYPAWNYHKCCALIYSNLCISKNICGLSWKH